jgi:hypothetical protein
MIIGLPRQMQYVGAADENAQNPEEQAERHEAKGNH